MHSVALQDLILSAPSGLRGEAENIFTRVFDSLMWTHISAGKVEAVSPLVEWTHRQVGEIETDLACLEINRPEILSALSDYLSNPDLSSKKADWLFLNVLVYAEYLATTSEIRKKAMGIERYVKNLFPPQKEHSTDISKFSSRPWHMPLAIVLIIFAWALHLTVGIVVSAYALYSAYSLRKSRASISVTLTNMLTTYLSFNNIDLSWTQVTVALERSRESGALWDSSLFALAELRTKARPYK